MTQATVLANARLVLPAGTVTGALRFSGGTITDITTGASVPRGAVDCGGDFVAPGLVELHTDNLERHLRPRPGVDWPPGAAIAAHDAELASAGITTVFDAVRIGSIASFPNPGRRRYARAMADQIGAMRAAGALKISHRMHLRAELCSETLAEELGEFGAADRVGIVSLMDHTPGQRQFADPTRHERHVRGKHAMSGDDYRVYAARLREIGARNAAAHARTAVAAARRLGAALASHDDTTAAHVAESRARGVAIAEFPTTAEAARACRAAGIAVMLGAPNLVRGGSHSGNVAAADLAAEGFPDLLSSDYVPAALLLGAVRLGRLWGDMAPAIATVTAAPARAAGLDGRGELAPGKRADLIRFRMIGETPGLGGVWANGRRVA